jgi:hypothetical protein
MNERLKLLLIILENSALYYVIGVWLGLTFNWKTILRAPICALGGRAVFEVAFY